MRRINNFVGVPGEEGFLISPMNSVAVRRKISILVEFLWETSFSKVYFVLFSVIEMICYFQVSSHIIFLLGVLEQKRDSTKEVASNLLQIISPPSSFGG